MTYTISVADRSYTFDRPVAVADALKALLPELDPLDMMGAFLSSRVLELTDVIDQDCDLRPITYQDEEGRRIYERSLRFVFLLAAGRCFPGEDLMIEHSIGQGLYVHFENRRLTQADVDAIEEEMRHIVSMALPFKRRRWTREKAIDYFRMKGGEDKARLLSYRPYTYFDVYELDGEYEYFYGAMLPSTAYTPVFSLRLYAPGLITTLPSRADPKRPAGFLSLPKHMAVYRESHDWCRMLGCATVAQLNGLIEKGGMRELIRVNEALHDKTLSEIAQDIVNRGARAVFIAGPSSSGKTTFANRLSIHLRVNRLRPVIISMDDFYIDRDKIPLEEDGRPDLEALTALDVELFRSCISSLLRGEETMMPRFNFETKKREEAMVPLRIEPDQPLIVEGIHALNPEIYKSFDRRLICLVYISQLTSVNLDYHNRIRTTDARLLRRLVRDMQFRGTRPEDTLAMWDSVREGEEKWIFPYQEEADIVFNSALHYELPFFRAIAYDILRAVPEDDPNFVRCNRLLKILHYMLPADLSMMDEIPPLSILREFLGGNTLYLHPENYDED